jgi:hypothetical protein
VIVVSHIGCFAPVNLVYDNAGTLPRGGISVQGNYSAYYSPEVREEGMLKYNRNLGLKLGAGLSDWWTLKASYECLALTTDFDFEDMDLKETDAVSGINYFEMENKFRIKDGMMALGIPLGFYYLGSDDQGPYGLFILDPRFYFTLTNKHNTTELNIIPKVHVMLGDGAMAQPGISMGIGLSTNLDNWVIRPELGYDGFLSIGIGVGICPTNLLKMKDKQIRPDS